MTTHTVLKPKNAEIAKEKREREAYLDAVREENYKERGENVSKGAYKMLHARKAIRLEMADKLALSAKLKRRDNVMRKKIEEADYDLLSLQIEDIPYNFATPAVAKMLLQIDLHDLLGVDREAGDIDCAIYKGNKAWIATDSVTGICRYFSESPSGDVTALSVYDLYTILYGYSVGQTFALLVDKLDLTWTGFDVFVDLQSMYLAAHKTASYLPKKSAKYPKLAKLMSKHNKTLIELINIASGNTIDDNYIIDAGNHITITSTDFVATAMTLSGNKTSKSTVAKDMRLLATLGLIKRHNAKELPAYIVDAGSRKTRHKKRTYFYDITYYSIDLSDDALAKAEAIASVLAANKITGTRITQEVLTDLFGEDFAKYVYNADLNKIEQIDDAKQEKEQEKEADKIEVITYLDDDIDCMPF